MSVLEKYKQQKRFDSDGHKEKTHQQRRDIDSDEILFTMDEAGFINTFDNGYVFNFEKDDLKIELVNQTSRLIYTVHKKVYSREENEMIRDLWIMESSSDYTESDLKEFNETYKYSHGIFDGSAYSAIKKFIEFFNKKYPEVDKCEK